MAGNYVEIVNPGYSTLYTRDLAYTPNQTAGESATLDVFNPDSANPLYEGEWLELTNASAPKFQRATGATSAPSTTNATSVNIVEASAQSLSKVPCFLHFAERGRYDAQMTKKAHCIVGPSGFEFKTKMCVAATSASLGAPVVVGWIVLPNGEHKRGLIVKAYDDDGTLNGSAVWVVGNLTRVLGTNHIQVQFNPHFAYVD